MSAEWIDRVETLAKEQGISLHRLGEEALNNRAYFRITRKRGSESPRKSTIVAIAKKLKVSPGQIFPELDSLDDDASDDVNLQSSAVDVPEIDVRGGAGGGGLVIEDYEHTSGEWAPRDAIRDNWGLPAAFLRHEARIRSGSANIIEISGDSMVDPAHPSAPGTLMPGDRAILDTSDTTPSPPGSFAVWDGIGVVVKMIEVVHGSDPVRLRLSSRNPAYQTYEILMDEARIIGRVRGRITVY